MIEGTPVAVQSEPVARRLETFFAVEVTPRRALTASLARPPAESRQENDTPGSQPLGLRGKFPGWHNISIEHFLLMSILTPVKSLRILLTLLLVALWPLVTSHCSLEHMPGLEFLACADEAAAAPHQENDCETDSCASVESGFYKTEDGRQVVPTPPLAASPFLTAGLLEAAQPATAGCIVFDSAPPELPKVWQFSHRAAAPPRAPSFVS